ncbi:hypothetical protein ACP70R_047265 [Stipagrostis hirtigluma subsp. patula]
MASPLPLLVLLLSSCCSIAHGADEQNYMVVATSSLKASTICSDPKVTPPKNGATMPLTHRHGPCSPVTSGEKAPSLAEMLRRDQLRAAYILAKISTNGTAGELGQSALTVPTASGYSLGTPEYVVTVSLGTPAVAQTVTIDTGSDVSWVQCAPCSARSCYSQKDGFFDPTKSSTYAAFPCGSRQCAQLGGEGNGCLRSQCQYVVQYGDGSTTKGTYGSDTLKLSPSAVVKGFQFGCSHSAVGFVGQVDGLMGLGGDTESLVSQTAAAYGKAFSYCLPPPGTGSPGFLTLGAAAGAPGFARTPMLRSPDAPTFYGVYLQAITVAGTRLNVPPAVFSGGSIVDSGTIITSLPPTAYGALRAAFRNAMKAYPSAAPRGILDTCFNFNGFSTIRVPKVTLTFSGGAAMDLDVSGLFYGSCLAFTPMDQDGDTGIFGNVQQRTFEVLYDVGGGSVGFRPGAC